MQALGCVGSPAVIVPRSWRLWKASRTGATWQPRAWYRAAVMRRPARCSEGGGEGEGREGEEGWSLEGQVERMLGEEESKVLLQDLNAAVERVAKARRELDALEEQQRRATFTESLMAADSLVEECQRNVFAAELDAKNAEIALVRARAGSSIMDLEDNEGAINRDVERMESGKAAAVSGVVGTLAGLPFFSASNLDGSELAVRAGIVFFCCCVFGLTYRYAIRHNLKNTQLKAGCVAAFALVRSLDAVRVLAALSPENASELLLQGCTFVTESIAIFCFAAVSVEYCFRQGFLSPFPSKPR